MHNSNDESLEADLETDYNYHLKPLLEAGHNFCGWDNLIYTRIYHTPKHTTEKI
jgi:hypothetical protein